MAFTKIKVRTMIAQIMLVAMEFWGKKFRVKLIEFADRLDVDWGGEVRVSLRIFT